MEILETRRYLAGDLWTQRGGDAGHDNYVDTSIDVSQLNHLWTASNRSINRLGPTTWQSINNVCTARR